MNYAEMRELVRLRYELRRLLAERPPGADADAAARTLIARIEALVAADAEEAAVVVPELARWEVSLASSRRLERRLSERAGCGRPARRASCARPVARVLRPEPGAAPRATPIPAAGAGWRSGISLCGPLPIRSARPIRRSASRSSGQFAGSW